MTTEYYYNILGLSPGASLREIKSAYRTKAKEFHPDLNKSSGAHENFIRLNEAYTFLLNYIEGSYDDEYQKWYDNWQTHGKQKARERAERRAKMNFEEFRKTDIYKTTDMLSGLLDYFGLLLGFFIIFASAFGMYVQGLYFEVEGEEVLNIRGVVLEIMTTIAGLFFITLAISNIRKHNKKHKKIKYD